MPYFPPLAIFILGWLVGIGLAPSLNWPWPAWLGVSAAGLAAAVITRHHLNWRNVAVAVVMFGLGAARWVWAQPAFDKTFIATYNNAGEATIEGIVIDEPDVRDTYVNLRIEVDTLQLKDSDSSLQVHGTVLAQVPRFPAFNYGDRIRAFGVLESPPVFEDFSYADYLARQGVYSLLRRATAETITNTPITDPLISLQLAIFKPLFAFKARALAAIAATFPEPQGSLLSGILLGVDSGIPESLQEAFRKTGTSHIVAISGFNISIIAGIVTKLFRRLFGARRAIPLAIIAIAVYSVLAGADASVVRAALMGSIVLIGDGFHRPSNGLASLAAASFLMTVFNPGTLLDVGFQLSAAATLGLILYAEPFTQTAARLLSRFTSTQNADRLVGAVGEYSILTLAAQVTTLPLMMFYFHQLSLISLLANLLVLPVQPQVMVLGGIATIGALIAQPLGWLLAWLAWPFVTFTIAMVELLAQVPGATIPIDRFPLVALAGMYGFIFGLTWLSWRKPDERPEWWRSLAASWLGNIVVASVAIGALATWNVYLHLPDGNLRATFFDVGHGDAVLIQTPSGRYALIDGGPSPNRLAESLGRTLPVGTRSLDLVVAASPTPDSLGGLSGLLDRYTLTQVVMAGEPGRNSAYREWTEGLASRSIPTMQAETGQQFDLGDGVMLKVVEVRDEGALLKLDYGNASFLFAVALDAKTATQIATSEAVAPATVLLAPRHGGVNSISTLFLDAVNPQAVVIAVGAGNSAGDPQAETLALFEGRTVLRTDQRGTIEFVTDGKQLWVEVER
ncbi:MAG: ComEC/Rec2 family competence protein [Chloroflexi bacterium]|nr:ComEC/Rec2 family competence protein [Chloroflexota bacterium]